MNKEFIKKLTELVEANLANESFGTEDLAKEMGMSHSNLNRKLKSVSHQTISQFIRELRLKKAKELLLNEDLTAAEISYRVGFGSPTYFNKCFHEYFGYAPGEMRNHEPENEPEEQPVEVELTPKKPNRRKVLIILIICSIFLVPISIFQINRASGSKAEKSIAVLPFKYLGDEPGKQFQADGMMSIIQSQLSKIYDLRVRSEASVEQYRNTDRTAKTIGLEMDVAYLLQGSLIKVEEQLKLILKLIKVKDDRLVWSNEYNTDSETFNILSKATEDVINEINAKITPEERQGIRKVQTTNVTAFEVYQQGKYYLADYDEDKNKKDILEKAQKCFHKSLEIDPKYALAWAAQAEIYWYKFEYGIEKKDNYLDSAIIMATRALGYDNCCSNAYLFRGLSYNEQGKTEQALKDCEKAVKYNPNNALAFTSFYNMNPKNNADDWIKSINISHEMVKRFRGTKEFPGYLWRLGRTYIEFGFPEQAEKYYKQCVEISQDSGGYLFGMEWVKFSSGNFEEAFRYAIKYYRFLQRQDTTSMDAEMFQYCTYSGHHKEAYEFAKKFVEICQ